MSLRFPMLKATIEMMPEPQLNEGQRLRDKAVAVIDRSLESIEQSPEPGRHRRARTILKAMREDFAALTPEECTEWAPRLRSIYPDG